jgi:pimeloyl-ACP methyl ester carboxylesterase
VLLRPARSDYHARCPTTFFGKRADSRDVEGDRVKTSVVLLPGLLCDARLWQPQIVGLGPGIEPWVADLMRDDSIAGMASRALAQAPFPKFALAGLSMGGYVAQEIMRQAPERIERLALLDTQARPETPEARERRLALMALAEKGEFAGVTDRLLPLLVHGSRLSDAPLVELIKDMAKNVGKDAFLRQQKAIMERPDSRDTLWKIRSPTLVLCGEHDLLTPRDRHEEIAAAIRGSTLVVLPGCGHLSTLEKPLEVNRALSAWLTFAGQAG